MATKLSVKEALGQFFRNFATGQGAGAATYTGYAPDQDTTLGAVLDTVDQIIDEIAAFTGQNSLTQLDLLLGIGPSTTGVVRSLAEGIVGARSFTVARITSDTQVQVDAGVGFAGGVRIETQQQFIATSSGGAGTRFIALNADGTISVNTTAAGGALDLYSISWSGTIFDAEAVRLARVYPEGDDFQALLAVTGLTGGAIPPQANLDFSAADRILEQIVQRPENLERVLNGLRTNALAGGPALGPIVIPGTAGAPGIVFGDGVSTIDATTGFFRQALNVIGVAVSGVERLRIAAQGLLAAQGGSAGAPVFSRTSDLDTGFFFPAADQMDAVAGGRTALRFEELSNIARALASGDGTAAAPDLSWIGDLDPGLFRKGANAIGVATSGTEAMELNASQQRNSATQGRASASIAVFNIADNTITNVDLTTEQYDVGTYHDNSTNPDRMTVPTSHDGNFGVRATVTFDESTSAGTPNAGDRGAQITVNGIVVAEARVPAAAAGDTALAVAIDVDLAATDIVRVTAFQDSGGAMDVSARLTVRHED